MIIVCEECGKKGTVDEQVYSGKKLRLRCPYCSHHFVFAVPLNGNHSGVTVAAATSLPGVSEEEPPPLAGILKEPEPASVPEEPFDAVAIILEAKRIARLIVSEIKLYNQEQIAKAASKKEVLDLLKDDLMRGKQHYNSRIAFKLPGGLDYFMETVKEILLAGKI